MKGLSTLVTFQALLATISSIYISKMSFMGRMGISFFYRDYQILKVWWQAALLLFILQLLLILLLWLSRKTLRKTRISFLPGFLLLLAATAAAYLTYVDFTTTSHKYLRSNFHLGIYLFWAGCALSCVYFMFVKDKPKLVTQSKVPDTHENIL